MAVNNSSSTGCKKASKRKGDKENAAPPPKKMKTLTNYGVTQNFVSRATAEQDMADEDVFEYLVSEARPLDTINQASFQRLVLKGRHPNVKMISRRALRRLIKKKNQERKEYVIKTFATAENVALTADCWESRNRGYIGISGHIITEDFERNSAILAMRRIRGKLIAVATFIIF